MKNTDLTGKQRRSVNSILIFISTSVLIVLIAVIAVHGIRKNADMDIIEPIVPTEEELNLEEKAPSGAPISIEAEYIQAPGYSMYNNGILLLCTDEQAYNKGNHFDAYVQTNAGLTKIEKHYFSNDYTLNGSNIHLEFEWAEHDGNIALSYVPLGMENVWISACNNGTENLLLKIGLEAVDGSGSPVYTNYPVLINLMTGELTDFLAGCEGILSLSLYDAVLSEDMERVLLTDTDGYIYYCDLKTKQLYSLDDISGRHLTDAGLYNRSIICRSYGRPDKGGSTLEVYKIWTIDLEIMCCVKPEYTLPEELRTVTDSGFEFSKYRPNKDYAGAVYMGGAMNRNIYEGRSYALMAEPDRSLKIIDLNTGDIKAVKSFIWPDDKVRCGFEQNQDGTMLLVREWEDIENHITRATVISLDSAECYTLEAGACPDVARSSWAGSKEVAAYSEPSGYEFYVYAIP